MDRAAIVACPIMVVALSCSAALPNRVSKETPAASCLPRLAKLIVSVAFGSKADIPSGPRHVRFTPKSGHRNSVVECPLCAKSGLMQCSINRFTKGTSLLMCPYGYFRASIIRFAIACCSSGGRSLIASVNLSGSPSARRREPARITMKAAQSCKMKNRRTIQMTKTTPNVIGQLKPKFRISPATATAMTKLTNQAIPRQSIGMWTPLECGLALPAV